MAELQSETYTRHRVEVDGFHFYYVMGDNFIQAFPDGENRPENLRERMVLDAFCGSITRVLGGCNE